MLTPRHLASIRIPLSQRRSLRVALGVTQGRRASGMNDLLRREAPGRTLRLGRVYVSMNLRALDTDQNGRRVASDALHVCDEQMRAAEAEAAAMIARMKARGTL